MEIIRASEIGAYVYCARAWWLNRVVEIEPEGRERRAQGTLLHTQHGHTVTFSQMLLLLAIGLFFAGVALAVISMLP